MSSTGLEQCSQWKICRLIFLQISKLKKQSAYISSFKAILEKKKIIAIYPTHQVPMCIALTSELRARLVSSIFMCVPCHVVGGTKFFYSLLLAAIELLQCHTIGAQRNCKKKGSDNWNNFTAAITLWGSKNMVLFPARVVFPVHHRAGASHIFYYVQRYHTGNEPLECNIWLSRILIVFD